MKATYLAVLCVVLMAVVSVNGENPHKTSSDCSIQTDKAVVLSWLLKGTAVVASQKISSLLVVVLSCRSHMLYDAYSRRGKKLSTRGRKGTTARV